MFPSRQLNPWTLCGFLSMTLHLHTAILHYSSLQNYAYVMSGFGGIGREKSPVAVSVFNWGLHFDLAPSEHSPFTVFSVFWVIILLKTKIFSQTVILLQTEYDILQRCVVFGVCQTSLMAKKCNLGLIRPKNFHLTTSLLAIWQSLAEI